MIDLLVVLVLLWFALVLFGWVVKILFEVVTEAWQMIHTAVARRHR